MSEECKEVQKKGSPNCNTTFNSISHLEEVGVSIPISTNHDIEVQRGIHNSLQVTWQVSSKAKVQNQI